MDATQSGTGAAVEDRGMGPRLRGGGHGDRLGRPRRPLIQRIYWLSEPLRRRRMAQFTRLFQLSPAHRVVDLGGLERNWRLTTAEPQVELVNLDGATGRNGRFNAVHGDARALPYPDGSFDLAYSNSVIEHVGTWDDQQAFAREVRRLAPSYYVQTPYRHFPLEVHTLTPFVQYLPMWAKRQSRWLTVWGWLTRPPPAYVADFWRHNRLLDLREMRELFPDATIYRERFFGLTKSLIAVRQAAA